MAAVLGPDSDTHRQLAAAHHAAQQLIDPEISEYCRWRIAQLLDSKADQNGPPERLDDVRNWPVCPRIDNVAKACLAFTEQFVIDVAAMPDDLVAPLRDAFGEAGLLDFANALLVTEQRIRLRLAWQQLEVVGAT